MTHPHTVVLGSRFFDTPWPQATQSYHTATATHQQSTSSPDPHPSSANPSTPTVSQLTSLSKSKHTSASPPALTTAPPASSATTASTPSYQQASSETSLQTAPCINIAGTSANSTPYPPHRIYYSSGRSKPWKLWSSRTL